VSWVLDVERAYVDAAVRTASRASSGDLARARAAAGAVASRYLAVGTPRSFGLIGDADDAALSLEAHRTWFAPRDIRSTAAMAGARVTGVDEALAADIVCVHVPLALAAAQLRRGTHVNLLAGGILDDALQRIATVVHEEPGLPALAAGLIDGRQLDEITVFVLGSAAIALAAQPRP